MRQRERAALAAAASFLFLAAAAPAAPPPPSSAPVAEATALQPVTGSVRGRIVDPEMSEPLSGVQVTIQGTRIGTLTNPAGNFLVVNVPVGEQVVVFEQRCYHRTAVQVEVGAGASSPTLVGLGLPYDHDAAGPCPRRSGRNRDSDGE